jgi:hypothetical protein
MMVWIQTLGTLFVLLGTMRQAADARSTALDFENSILSPSLELLNEQLDVHLRPIPRWRRWKRWWRKRQVTRDFYQEVWTDDDRDQRKRFKRHMWNWVFLGWGALAAIVPSWWITAFG